MLGGEEAGQVMHRLRGVEGGIGVADGVHAVPQCNQDGGEEQRQAHLDHRHQDLPLLWAGEKRKDTNMGARI